eukprot:2167401-Rhodomonas_salina.2
MEGGVLGAGAPLSLVASPIGLRACYAMSGTKIANGGALISAYAPTMSGTEKGNMRCPVSLVADSQTSTEVPVLAWAKLIANLVLRSNCSHRRSCTQPSTISSSRMGVADSQANTDSVLRFELNAPVYAGTTAPIGLHAQYKMSGTGVGPKAQDDVYKASGTEIGMLLPGTSIVISGLLPEWSQTCIKCTTSPGICLRASYAKAVLMQRMVLRQVRVWCYGMWGTNIAYGATPCTVLTSRMARPGWSGGKGCSVLCEVSAATCLRECVSLYLISHYAARFSVLRSPMLLSWLMALCYRLTRICYAMPGTEIAYGAMSIPACYAMSGTDLAYDAMRCPVLTYDLVLSADAHATRCPVLT